MSSKFEVKTYGPASNGWLYVTCDGERIADVRNQEAADALIAGLQAQGTKRALPEVEPEPPSEPLVKMSLDAPYVPHTKEAQVSPIAQALCDALPANYGAQALPNQSPRTNDAWPHAWERTAANVVIYNEGYSKGERETFERLRPEREAYERVGRLEGAFRRIAESEGNDVDPYEIARDALENAAQPSEEVPADAKHEALGGGPWTEDHNRAQKWLANHISRGHAMGFSVDALFNLLQEVRRDERNRANPQQTPETESVPTQEPHWQVAMRRATEAEQRSTEATESVALDKQKGTAQMNQAKDETLADELISRLNALIESPGIRADIARLIECRVPASPETVAHDTIQVTPDDSVGFLGILNGIVGVVREGSHAGAGYIGAEFDDNGVLARFVRTGVEAK